MPDKPNKAGTASPDPAPLTFNAQRRARLQRRAAQRRARLKAPQFIFERLAHDMADRLLMINRRFNKVLLIAPRGVDTLFKAALSPDKTPATFISTALEDLGPTLGQQSGFDLIILCCAHQAENDPRGLLSALKGRMIDDAHLMSVCLGGETLSALRQALYVADQSYFDGISPRIHPMIELQPNVKLLAHCGFNLTVGDRDRLTVHYKALSTLVDDLRDMGETYALSVKSSRHTPRAYWSDVEQDLKAGQARFEIIYDILWASGWTPHDSQQKPLKPGSAQTHLSEIFKQQK